ncbi:sperm-associated antigen 17 isoform X5 [Hemibagrus wyckioides]|uniref:sperm-associated antigen 17 isoform X5 n=1 Tax=Hemibagrus wyckioides TaxID=337641 RepID=UPI00266C61D9|nr:sperm-associated antigen 17 isoform X5 [Hemibagrus wyckioides]
MNSAIVVFLNNVEKVRNLIQKGIIVNNESVLVSPLSSPAKKVMLSNVPPFISDEAVCKELSRYGRIVSPIKRIPLGCKSPLVKHLVSFRRMVFMVFKEGVEELNAVFKFRVEGFDYNIFVSSDTDIKCFKCGKTGHLVRACPERQSDPGVSERPGQDAAESAGVVPPAAVVRPAAEGPGAAAVPDMKESKSQAQAAAQDPTGAKPAPEKPCMAEPAAEEPCSAQPDREKPCSTEKSSVGSGAVLELPALAEAGTEVQSERPETPDTTPVRGTGETWTWWMSPFLKFLTKGRNKVLDRLDAVSVEVCMIKSSVLNTLMSKHLDTNSLNTARRHELLHYCSIDSLRSADVQRLLQMCVFESMPLTAVDESGAHTLAASHTPLPWDDPVTFTHTVHCSLNTTPESRAVCEEPQENKFSVEDLQKTLLRLFRHWNFTEHHSADVFPQVFQTVSESYRCVDSFHSTQSNVTYIICHSPMSPERSSRGSWEVSLHTDVRFRSYLENVAESIRDWSRAEEERLQQQQEETEEIDTTTKGVSVVQSEVFIRHDSLKAWKLEQEQKDEDVMRKMKKEKGGKSSAKGGERAESTRESRRSQEDGCLTPPTEHENPRNPKKERTHTHTHTEDQPVFTGYRMDGRLVQVRGESQCVYPSDGGQISVERVHYVQGSTRLKVCVRKNDHCFYTHLIEPERQNPHDQRQKIGSFYSVLSNGLTLAYSNTHQDGDDVSPLQLHVSLPTGLQIHFSFQHTAHGQGVLVHQSLPYSGSKFPATHTELSRTITCDGAVIKHMRDGSTVVLFADGTVSVSPVCVSTGVVKDEDTSTHTQSRDTKVKPSSGVGVEGVEPTLKVELKEQVELAGASWCTTTPSGVRIRTIRGEQVEEKPVLNFYSTDPQTHSVVVTRDDGVLCLLEKHRVVVDHADGTRMISDQQRETLSQQLSGSSDGGRASSVKVEKSGFAPVMVKCEEKSAKVLFRDGTTISATAHGSYRVCLSDGSCLCLSEDGVAVYSITGPEGDQRGRYTMSHSGGFVCELTDSEGNHYQVTAEGGVSISHTDTESKAQHNTDLDTHTPRLFMVYADGSALEFLSSQTVDKILQKEKKDPTVAVVRDPIPHTHEAFAITILKPFSDLSSYWLSPKHLDDIIPANLKSRKWDTFPTSEVKTSSSPFGVSLGRGLELKERTTLSSDPTSPVLQNPNTLLIRRITEHTPFTQQHYKDLQHKLLSYINQLLQREKLSDEMKLKDPQAAEQKRHRSDLLQIRSDSTPGSTPQSMLSLYSQAVGVSHTVLSNQHGDQQVTHSKQKRMSGWRNRIHQHRLDLQEEVRHRYALRNHIITSYFHPELQEIQQELKSTSLSQTLPSFPERRNSGLQKFSSSYWC